MEEVLLLRTTQSSRAAGFSMINDYLYEAVFFTSGPHLRMLIAVMFVCLTVFLNLIASCLVHDMLDHTAR